MYACLPGCSVCIYTCVASVGHIFDYVEVHLCGELCDDRTVGGAQLQGMMKSSTHHKVNAFCVMYLKCISLFIGSGVSLATFKMYHYFGGACGLVLG